ncbi:Transient receptor potential cation channel subfamily A member 1 [Holothuria leucospilota]|uniref:Transient receptor potential cation channel subfamily A member 1 n=1 Tax=Holothuria leucospilota TaxID=206669 RepID=A0A9Q1H6R3_HOLLE|nr:Transient receptor potential cation channel subfamily A member 1 [Holothuria leucospilota]
MCAAWKGNCEAGNLLINEGAAVDTTDSDSKTCLHMAVEMDHVNFVKMLLQKDCDDSFINATSKHEWTALHFAAENGNTEILQCLLDAGANITARDYQERTPLHVAASFGRLPFVEAVLLEKPDLINESDKCGMNPLLLASKHDHHHVVRYLIKMGADISSRNSSEMTALSLAAMKGNVHVITVLLQFTVNVNAQDKDWEDSADLLLNANANICILNRRRQSVLDLAAIYKRDLIASSILKSKNWEKAMSLRDSEGNTPLKMLIETLPKCAEIVLDKCILHSHSDHTRPDYAVTYDFRYIDPGPDDISTLEQKKRYFATQVGI